MKYFNQKPSKEEVESDLKEFLDKKKDVFRGYLKAGKTLWKSFGRRYARNDKYEGLTAEHIFAKCSTEQIALDVEKMCQQYLKSIDRMVELSNLTDGGSRGDLDQCCVVYITQLKADLFACPRKFCNFISQRDYVLEHIKSHQDLLDAQRANMLLNKIGSSHVIRNVTPVPYVYEAMDRATTCRYCDKKFEDHSTCSRHRLYNCAMRPKDECELYGREVCHKQMEKHLRNYHQHLNRVECDLCGKQMTYESLEYHMTVHVGINKIPCEICGKKISFKAMKEHVAFMHEGKQRDFVLKTCKICFKEVKHMRVHMITHEEEKKKCPYCSQYVKVLSLKCHIKEVHFKHEQDVVSCPQCGKTGTKSFMRSHAMTHMPRKTCEICGKSYSHDKMRKHLQTHTSNPPAQKKKSCPYCGNIYSSNDLSSHIKRVHQKTEPTPDELLTCSVCGKKGTKTFMLCHKKTHIRQTCPTCNKELSVNGLRLHKCQSTSQSKASTSPIKPKFKCLVPSCSFEGSKASLATHQRVHNPQIACSYCGKMISHGNISKHLRVCKLAPSTSKNPPK